MRRVVAVCVLPIVLSFVSAAESFDFTVLGSGGVSPSVAGVSNASFWWAGTGSSSEVSGSTLTAYGLDPLSGTIRGITPAPYAENDLYNGSLLVSTDFTVNGTQSVTVTFGELSSAKFGWGNFAFAALLQNSQTAAILGVENAVGNGSTSDEPYPGTIFTKPTSGVNLTADYVEADYPAGFQLGNSQYGCYSNDNGPNAAGPCQSQFTLTYTPAAGTYQLLFGDFGNANGPTAVAVKSVRVPEEGSVSDLWLILIVCVPYLLWRRRSLGWRKSSAVNAFS